MHFLDTADGEHVDAANRGAVGGCSRPSMDEQPVRPPASVSGCSLTSQSGKSSASGAQRRANSGKARLLTVVEL